MADPLLPGRRLERAIKVLGFLSNELPPRSWMAVLRTMLSGWCTRRRFPQAGLPSCMLGCDAEDSIQHYASCRQLHQCLGVRLNLGRKDTPAERLQDFLLLDSRLSRESRHEVICRALYTATAYRIHNWCRYGGRCSGLASRRSAPLQHFRDAVQGHAEAMKALDSAWIQRCSNGTT